MYTESHSKKIPLCYYTFIFVQKLFQIDDVKETDDGFYRCEISINMYNTMYAEIELVVVRPPFFYDNSSKSMVVPEGQKVKLECYAGGYPTPKVYWRRQDHSLLFTGRPSHG